MPLNGITLGQAITDPINGKILITEYTSDTEYAIERQLINLCQIDTINHMIPLSMIPLSAAHCIS